MDGEAFSCFSFDSPDCYGTKYATIVSWLRRAVEEVDKARASVATSLEAENGFQAIFVAPEYMFAGENSGKRRSLCLSPRKMTWFAISTTSAKPIAIS
jgi:hypothetical protein